jgi:CBS domain-containing protein
MFVSDILAHKGGLVFTVPPSATLSEVTRQLSTRRIGAVLVVDRLDQVVGIVSERDLVHAVAVHGSAALGLVAAEVMTREVVSCDPDDPIERVMEIMTSGRFRHLPVVRNAELLGLISIGDVVRLRLEEATHETEALKAYIVAG